MPCVFCSENVRTEGDDDMTGIVGISPVGTLFRKRVKLSIVFVIMFVCGVVASICFYCAI